MKSNQQFKTITDQNGRRQWKINDFIAPTPEMYQASLQKRKDPKKTVKPIENRKINLHLADKVGKTLIVAKEGMAGFSCDKCGVSFNDSIAYLDHINGRDHHRVEGISMAVEKVGVDRVKAKLEDIRRQKEKQEEVAETFEEIDKRLERQEKAEKCQKKKKKKVEEVEEKDVEEEEIFAFGLPTHFECKK